MGQPRESENEASRSTYLRIAMLAAGALILNGIAMARGVECDRETISVVVSPDNAWVALVREGTCSDGGFVTIATDTVQLVRRDSIDTIKLAHYPDEPEHENDVLVIEDHGHPANRPLTQWLSPQKLQVTIPNISGVGLQKKSYDGVDIVIKYEPDDPAAREKWQKEHGLAPK
jgi:hypothetical protein